MKWLCWLLWHRWRYHYGWATVQRECVDCGKVDLFNEDGIVTPAPNGEGAKS